jgi:hypothetical protein
VRKEQELKEKKKLKKCPFLCRRLLLSLKTADSETAAAAETPDIISDCEDSFCSRSRMEIKRAFFKTLAFQQLETAEKTKLLRKLLLLLLLRKLLLLLLLLLQRRRRKKVEKKQF